MMFFQSDDGFVICGCPRSLCLEKIEILFYKFFGFMPPNEPYFVEEDEYGTFSLYFHSQEIVV